MSAAVERRAEPNLQNGEHVGLAQQALTQRQNVGVVVRPGKPLTPAATAWARGAKTSG
jgi:hypothetical protein